MEPLGLPKPGDLVSLEAGLPTVVHHGYLIDLPHHPGPLLVDADGTVTELGGTRG